MRIPILLPALLALTTISFGQNIQDALRLSQTTYGGTARALGSGGAFTALGADFASASLNPAGMAMFRSDELMFTPVLRIAKTDAALPGGQVNNDEANRFQFGNFGVVFNTNRDSAYHKWRTTNFGIGFNQVANYRQSVYYSGESNGTILTNWYNEYANTPNPDNLDGFGSGMALEANALYTIDGQPAYDFLGNADATVNRSQLVNSYGQTNEMTFSLAGNYMDRVMLGATFGVPFTTYRQEGDYNEVDPGGALDGNIPYFDNLNYTEYLRTSGVGINFKLGATIRVTQAFRIGGAFHSPTFYGLTDRFSNSFRYDYEDGGGQTSNSAQSPDGTFDYKLRTPARAMFGGAFLIKKVGFISADVEWVDYGASHFNLTSDVANAGNKEYERELNNDMQRTYQSVLNYRIGGEIAAGDFRFRAGYNLNGRAKVDATGFDSAITGGAGIRMQRFYMDLGVRHRTDSGVLFAYSGAPEVSTSRKVNDILLTVGFKF